MPTSPDLQLSALRHPRPFEPSLADVVSSTSVLSLTPSTQSPPDSPILPMSLAVSLPPELLLDIFSCFSNSPSEISSDEDELYLERNRNLKSFALVHTKWRKPAQETLRKEVVLCAYEGSMQGMETLPWGDITQELSRKTQILVDAGVRGTQYLSVYGRLDVVIGVSGMAMWDNVRHLSLYGSSRSDGKTSLSDFAGFPSLERLHLFHNGECVSSDLLPSAKHLRLPKLRDIYFDGGLDIDCINLLSHRGGTTSQQFYLDFQELSRKLFLPTNMPSLVNLRIHVALHTLGSSSIYKDLTYWNKFSVSADGTYEQVLLSTIRSMGEYESLSIIQADSKELLRTACSDPLPYVIYLSSWMLELEPKLLSRLVNLAKGEDPRTGMGNTAEVVVCGTKLADRLKFTGEERILFEWREDERRAIFDDYDGR